jgi:hypothetical protein
LFRNYYLNSNHYAAQWKVREISDRHDRDEINQKAIDWSTSTDPEQRERLQLEILEAFHGYLIKYFNLILFNMVPMLSEPQGRDAQAFLRLLLPKGTPANFQSLRTASKHLHLAFKDCTTSEEVYDILVTVFLDVCSHYDPHYAKKIEEVCNFVSTQPAANVIALEEFADALGFDPLRCIRVLVRNGYLESVSSTRKKVQGYRRGKNWPAPQTFFESGPVGFVYFVTTWFRYYLQAYILGQMAQLESQEHILQLDHIQVGDEEDSEHGWTLGALPHAEGEWVDHQGVRWAADVSMLDHWKTLDISEMTDEWVKHTDDFLFRTLKPRERYLLQLKFVKEMTWTEVAAALDVNVETARNWYNDVMRFLIGRAACKPTKLAA